ncbi:MAG: ABC transporter permease [bacterium]|nr:ABC transporter permease [bacterium]
MTRFIAHRIAQIIPLLILLSVFIFTMMHLAPGSPESFYLTDHYTDEQAEAVREKLGLNEPPVRQYLTWLGAALRGDFGQTFTYGATVTEVILARLWPTVQLQMLALTVSVVIALPAGVISALRRNSKLDHTITTATLFGLSMPDFWFALLLMLTFSVHLGWLPAFGTGSEGLFAAPTNLVMPVAVLGLSAVPWYARVVRSSMLDSLAEDFILTAAAKGLKPSRITIHHALRIAILPLVTVIGLSMARVLSGVIVVETIFVWPGLGQLAWEAVIRQDYPVILGLTIFTAAFVMIFSLIVDILYTYIDPRIRYV